MYYLLGYRLLGNSDDSIYTSQTDISKASSHPAGGISNGNFVQRSRIFRNMNASQRIQVGLMYLG